MQEISAYELIKEKLHAIPNLRHKGSLFEKISKQFLQEHDSANEYESIDLWYDWELRGKERDKGIDIVITTSNKDTSPCNANSIKTASRITTFHLF